MPQVGKDLHESCAPGSWSNPCLASRNRPCWRMVEAKSGIKPGEYGACGGAVDPIRDIQRRSLTVRPAMMSKCRRLMAAVELVPGTRLGVQSGFGRGGIGDVSRCASRPRDGTWSVTGWVLLGFMNRLCLSG
jgi:hypothetical protein